MKILTVHDGLCDLEMFPKNHLQATARLVASPLVSTIGRTPGTTQGGSEFSARAREPGVSRDLKPLYVRLRAPAGINMSQADFEQVVKILEADIPELR
jgi:hypothetical protein